MTQRRCTDDKSLHLGVLWNEGAPEREKLRDVKEGRATPAGMQDDDFVEELMHFSPQAGSL